MKRLLTLVAFFATVQASAQQVNPVPDYVFRNQMSVGRNAVTDTAAYFSIGPRYGATKGFMPPIVGDTATFSSGKRNGLLIFSVQKNKFLYWDSVRVQWSDMAGSSGSYITGSGITGYLPQFSASTTLDTSALFTLGNRLGIGTSTFAYNSTNTANIELNGTAGGILGFKRNDSARGYLWHTGDNMELANTTAGSISFNTNSATRGSISSAGVWRLHNLAGTGDRVVQASSNGTLSATTSVTGLVDTTTISTRAWRQKGDDSLGAIIATKGSGTVTSVATGYGLSGGTITTTGTLLVDTLNIATRAWRQKGLDSLAALGVSGSGTTNYVPKFTAGSTIGNSQIQDNGSGVGIGVNPDSNLKLYVRPNSTTGTAIYSDNGANSGFVVKYNGAITNIGNDFNAPLALFTNNTERLRIFANGRVFIGASPTDAGYQLDVNGSLRAVNGANFATTSGNVGIGNASPSFKLSVNSSDYQIGNLASTYITGGINYNALIVGQIALNQSAQIGYARDTSNAANSFFYVTPYGSAEGGQFRMSAAGNVGIGFTSNPSYKLDINGTLRSVNGANFATTSGNVLIGTATASSVSTARLSILGSGVQDSYIQVMNGAGGGFLMGSLNGTGMQFYTLTGTQGSESGTKRMEINSNGEMLINTSTDAGDYKLQVSGNIYNTGSAVLAATSGNVGVGGTSPQAKLDVYGAFRVSSATFNIPPSGAGIEYSFRPGDSTGYVLTFSRDYNTYRNQRYFALTHRFSTSNSELDALFINANQETLINTTTDAGDYKLQVSGNIYNTGSAVLAATSGGVAIGTTTTSGKLNILGDNDQININTTGTWSAIYFKNAGADRAAFYVNNTAAYIEGRGSSGLYLGGAGATAHVNLNSNGELIIGTGAADAGDYKLQVVGNARIGTGKLDIASNTTFGIGVARSGTSEVAGQIYNSNGILYFGAESSAGGQIFSGSSAYAGVIGTGANYPLQFATNNATRATINTNGELLINTLTDNGDFKLQVNGNALISGSIKTANGTSSTAVPWHLGSVVATNVQLDTANYVEVEINGTFYRLAIVTPL